MRNAECGITHRGNGWQTAAHCAASAPSEEGGGCLHKGFEQADGGRDTPSICESSRYSRQQRQMTAFSFGARLHLGANSRLAVSLPQSRCFNSFSPRQLPPQREPRALPRQRKDSPHSNRFYRKMRSAALFRSVFGRSSPIFFSKFVKK